MQIHFKSRDHFLTCEDHFFSGKKFELFHDPEYDLLSTVPKPSEEELSAFYQTDNYISHTDSNKTWIDKMYQLVKSVMLRRKINLLEKYKPQKGELLDIGSGTGDFLKTAQELEWNVEGTEPNEDARRIAEKKELLLQKKSGSYSTSRFDVITMWHVLEHVYDLETQLKELDRLLKKDGVLIIAVPNFKSYDAAHYGKFWAAYDVPRHLWHFSKTAISKLFKKNDFEVVEILPLKFDAYYVSLLSEKYKSGRNNYFRAFRTGYISNWKAASSGEYSSHIYVLKRIKT